MHCIFFSHCRFLSYFCLLYHLAAPKEETGQSSLILFFRNKKKKNGKASEPCHFNIYMHHFLPNGRILFCVFDFCSFNFSTGVFSPNLLGIYL